MQILVFGMQCFLGVGEGAGLLGGAVGVEVWTGVGVGDFGAADGLCERRDGL